MGLHIGGARSAPRINVTPLVDIVLVLLIIFIVLVPAVEVRLPSARHSGPAEGVRALQLILQDDDQVRVESAGHRPRLLPLRGGEEVWAGLGDLRDRRIQLRADAGRPYRDLQRVLDHLRTGGADHVFFMTAQPGPGGSR